MGEQHLLIISWVTAVFTAVSTWSKISGCQSRHIPGMGWPWHGLKSTPRL